MHTTASRGTHHGISHSTLTCFKCLTEFILKAMRNPDLSPEEREDCASAFIVKMLTSEGCVLAIRYGGCDQCRKLLPTCAHHFRVSYQIDFTIRTKREIPLSVLQRDEELADITKMPELTEEPLAIIKRHEFWNLVDEVMEPMTPDQKDMMTYYYKDGESIEKICQATGRTKHAVTQALYADRRRLIKLMEKKGLTAEELRSYFK